jgi:predicted CXXCH cytochrome family protein
MGGNGRRSAVASAAAALLALPGATGGAGTQRCTDCHAVERNLSHPVGVFPSMVVPRDLPLSDGRVACTTCHDEAGPRHPSGEAPGALLRGEPASLCAACHDSSGQDRREIHAAAVSRAHLLWPQEAGRSGVRSGGLDLESAACISCHDGTVASLARYRPPGAAMRPLAGEHPIGVEQRQRWPDDHLRPPYAIDPRVRLFDGRVGCGSCHSPYSPVESLLVMPNHRSALCLSCHAY